jgi:gamma-glutamylcyclotransferase (GGCT)/AIG2-like uncharacterized protein YtfP
MNGDLLFVYGTLRPEFGHGMHGLLQRNAEFEGTGAVLGRLFDLGRYPGMVLSDVVDERVIGEVYRLRPAAGPEVLRELDAYEGDEYRREILQVKLTTGSSVDAWAYVLKEIPDGRPRIQSGDFLEWCRAAK